MSKKFLTSIDLNKNELQNAVLQKLATAPSSPVAGQTYYSTTDNKAYIYNGTAWVPWEADTNTVTGVKGDSESAYRTGDVNITAANVGAAPTSHATTLTTYGRGTSSHYGHVKLSDATNSTTAAASGGTAATPKAVSDALTAAKDYADGIDVGVTSVQVQATSPVVSSVDTAQTSTLSTTISLAEGYGHIQNPYGNVGANQVLAGLNGSSGLPQFRNLVDADIPSLPASKITSGTFASARIPDLSGTYVTTTKVGAANGVASLDSSGLVPSSQLPAYVDDVLEYASLSDFPETGESGKIYVAKDTNKTYRWSGTAYVEISASLALGETSSTAYRGDRGKTAYDHASDSSKLSTATASGLYKVASTAQGHIASLTAVAKSDITGLGIPAQDTTYSVVTSGTSTTSGGLMSQSDKKKLDGIAAGAQVNPTYTAVTGKPTANQTPSFGDTFTISQISQATSGQISATDRTVTIPSATASSSANGLMSSTDKAKIDSLTATQVKNATLRSGATSISILMAAGETLISYWAFDGSTREEVVVDVARDSGGTAYVFTIAAAYANDIKIYALMLA